MTPNLDTLEHDFHRVLSSNSVVAHINKLGRMNDLSHETRLKLMVVVLAQQLAEESQEEMRQQEAQLPSMPVPGRPGMYYMGNGGVNELQNSGQPPTAVELKNSAESEVVGGREASIPITVGTDFGPRLYQSSDPVE